MSANLEIKKQVVEEIKGKIAKAKTIVFVDYKGINVEKDTALRRAVRKEDAEYKVYKNKLLSKAFAACGIEGVDEFLNGTTAVAFGYGDETCAPRLMNSFAKSNEKLVIKAGVLNGKAISDVEVKKLASIPSREVLVATLLRTLNGPIATLARALNAIATK